MKGAYYNENDPYAAQWLRNLIRGGHIADGDVDERSIVDVRPDDLCGYAQCHFFAGIGGWSYALRLAGWPDDHHVWTGSCPCQPLSGAGQRKGHADERHLWPAFYRLIAERAPAIVFGEQVASADGREWLAGIRADLEGLGYAVGAADLCAPGVGAPHIRQRLYWLADAGRRRYEQELGSVSTLPRQAPEIGGDHLQPQRCRATRRLADAVQPGRAERRAIAGNGSLAGGRGPSRLAYTDGGFAGDGGLQRSREKRQQPQDGHAGGMAHADVGRADRREHGVEGAAASAREGEMGGQDGERLRLFAGGDLGLGDAEHGGREGRDAVGRRSGAALPPSAWSAFDLIPCTDGKARRVEPGSFPLAHGIPNRVGRLRAYGNAIIPQVAAAFIECCMTLSTQQRSGQ